MKDMNWEYKVIQLHPDLSIADVAEALNAHGSQGWEAITSISQAKVVSVEEMSSSNGQ